MITNPLRFPPFLLLLFASLLPREITAPTTFQNDSLVKACQRFGDFKQVTDLPEAEDGSKRTPLEQLLARCLLATAIVSIPYKPLHYTHMRELQYLKAKGVTERVTSKLQKWTEAKSISSKAPQALDDKTYANECLTNAGLTNFQSTHINLIKLSWCSSDHSPDENEAESAKALRHTTLRMFFVCVVGGMAVRNHQDSFSRMLRHYLYPILYDTACGGTQPGKYQKLTAEAQENFKEKVDETAAYFFLTIEKDGKIDIPCFNTDVKFHDQIITNAKTVNTK